MFEIKELNAAELERQLGIKWIANIPLDEFSGKHIFWTHMGYSWNVFQAHAPLKPFKLESAFDKSLNMILSNGWDKVDYAGRLHDLARELQHLNAFAEKKDIRVTMMLTDETAPRVRELLKYVKDTSRIDFFFSYKSTSGNLKIGSRHGSDYERQGEYVDNLRKEHPDIYVLGTYAQQCVCHSIVDLTDMFGSVTVLSGFCLDRGSTNTFGHKYDKDASTYDAEDMLQEARICPLLQDKIDVLVERGRELYGSDYSWWFNYKYGKKDNFTVLDGPQAYEVLELN